jgi:hypothetical protein
MSRSIFTQVYCTCISYSTVVVPSTLHVTAPCLCEFLNFAILLAIYSEFQKVHHLWTNQTVQHHTRSTSTHKCYHYTNHNMSSKPVQPLLVGSNLV